MKKSYLALPALAIIFAAPVGANEVFTKHCAACHAGGKNIMNAEKTLTKESLEKNGVNTVDAIKALVTKGKAPMPAFEKTLSAEEIDSVASYVLEQAEKGW